MREPMAGVLAAATGFPVSSSPDVLVTVPHRPDAAMRSPLPDAPSALAGPDGADVLSHPRARG
jgi:hypothetical protein